MTAQPPERAGVRADDPPVPPVPTAGPGSPRFPVPPSPCAPVAGAGAPATGLARDVFEQNARAEIDRAQREGSER